MRLVNHDLIGHVVVWFENAVIYIYIPGTCLSSILGFEPSKRRPFPFKTRFIWVPGIFIYTAQLYRTCSKLFVRNIASLTNQHNGM